MVLFNPEVGIKGVHALTKGNNPKINLKARLKFELGVQYVNNITGTSPPNKTLKNHLILE